MKDKIVKIIKILLAIILIFIIILSILTFILYLKKPNFFKSSFLALKGTMLSEKHREAEALEIFKKAETLDPTNPVVYDAIARSYARLERWDEAIKYLKKGIEKTPKEESFYKLVYAYYMCRDLTKEAKEYFSDLLNRNPKNKLAAKYLRLTQGFEIFRGSTQEKLKQEKR